MHLHFQEEKRACDCEAFIYWRKLQGFGTNLECTSCWSFSVEAFTLVNSIVITSNEAIQNHLTENAIVSLSLSLSLSLQLWKNVWESKRKKNNLSQSRAQTAVFFSQSFFFFFYSTRLSIQLTLVKSVNHDI